VIHGDRGRDGLQRCVCHIWKRMSCQTPVIRRGSEVRRRGKEDAQPATGEITSRMTRPLKCPMRMALTNA
jgi:hypothetical protein